MFITSLATKVNSIVAGSPGKFVVLETYLKTVKGWTEFVQKELAKIREREDRKIGEGPTKSAVEFGSAEQHQPQYHSIFLMAFPFFVRTKKQKMQTGGVANEIICGAASIFS